MQYAWSGALQYVWSNAPVRSYAPAISNDGQVMLYSPDQLFAEEGEFVTLRTTAASAMPHFRTLVGNPYRLSATAGVSLTGASIAMS